MTAQICEKLFYEGQQLSICTEPLGDYFALTGIYPGFNITSTAMWRGYVGTWEIRSSRLYLIGLRATLMDGSAANVATLFPDYPDRVFAHWYSGMLRIPQGKMLEYIHMNYRSTYEKDLMVDIVKGVVTATSVRHNGCAIVSDATDRRLAREIAAFRKARQIKEGR